MKAARKLNRGSGGFTLVELLVAITIVLIFGAMATQTLKAGAEMWRTGYRRSFAYDTSTVIFQQIQDDLSAAKNQFWGSEADAYDPRVRFWVDYDNYPSGGRQWLRFVRAIPDYSVNPRIRNAGTVAGATGYYNLMQPAVATDNDLIPLEGMCEVAYMLGLDSGGLNPDSTTLYRAVLAPIGNTTGVATDPGYTFFGDLSAQNAFLDSARIHDKALPLAQDVIYFELRLWTQYSTSWRPDNQAYESPAWPHLAYAPWQFSYAPSDCGAVFTWDSSRMPGVTTPVFTAMDEPQPGVPVGQDAISDNVFPRALMAVVTIEPPNSLSLANPLRLRTSILANDTQLPLIGDAPPMNEGWPFVKIDDEWIRVNPVVDKTTNSMIVVDVNGNPSVTGRGVRGTAAVAHNSVPLPRVLIGYTFTRVFNNPAARESWGQ